MGGRKNIKPKLTAEDIRQLIDYDPETGIVTANVRLSQRCLSGSRLGYLHHTGYWHIELKDRKYHRSNLVWCWMTGEWPVEMVDHRNGTRSDDRWENLRAATNGQNRANSVPSSNTGFKGVWLRTRYEKGKPRYVAQITINGKVSHLGHFDTPEAASAAYQAAAKIAFGEFMRVF